VAGKPAWSSNRKMTAEENARSHFQRDGADFDSKTVDDFVAKAHAFTSHPPKGAQTLQRPNGDVLLYDEKTNTFAVMSREGAPRTMFKPRNGASYWEAQIRKEKEKSSGE
jgi:pyocin large subunit-like protein